MKTTFRKNLAVWCVAISLITLDKNTEGQGFVNLNFEQASVVAASSGYTPTDAFNALAASSAFPGWIIREDGTICNAVWGSPVAIDETSVALVSAGYLPIQGNYSVQLTAYADAPAGYYRSSSISQTALIPIGTQSIQFLVSNPVQAGSVQANPIVMIDGTPVSLAILSQAGGVTTIGGNIGTYAGTTATLSFLCQATQGGTFPANENMFNLDGITFSPSPVPEPSMLALSGLGGLLLACRRWKKTV